MSNTILQHCVYIMRGYRTMNDLKEIIFNIACRAADKEPDKYINVKQVKLTDIEEDKDAEHNKSI